FVDRPRAPQRARGTCPATVVLQTAVGAIDGPRIHRYVVELSQSHVVEVIPTVAAIIGLVEAAVAADDHVPAILGIDPQGVLIGVDAAAHARHAERLAAILGYVHRHPKHPNVVLIAGVDADL